MDGNAVARCAIAHHAQPAIPGSAVIDQAQDITWAMAQADQGAKDRRARDKGLGAVDGIDRPDELGISLVVWKLFSDAAVLRAPVCDHVAQAAFDGRVKFAHRTGRHP